MDDQSYRDVAFKAQVNITVPSHPEGPHREAASTTSHALELSSNGNPPRQVLSKEQWEELRPLISRLYIDENKTFKAVAAVLWELHNFAPTCVSLYPRYLQIMRLALLIFD